MKSFIKLTVPATWLLCLTACQDLTELNVNPNQLGADEINAKYVLTSALAQTANFYIRDFTYGYTSEHGISESMQYLQRDYIGYEINSFVWKPTEYNSFSVLTDSQTLLANSAKASTEETRRFYKGVASVLRAFWFGFYSSAWGDIPYQEALQGDTQLFKPLYNQQRDVFKGILEELKTANQELAGLGTISAVGSSDILFGGNAVKWRKFANALRIRYYIRLGTKSEELKSAGVDIAGEIRTMLANPADHPLLEGNSDNAAVAFPGTDAFTSWIGGPLANSNRSQFYRRKPCSTIINHLKHTGDPRLTSWFRPVDVQLKVGAGSAEYVKSPSGQLIRYVPQYSADLDTSLYVGLRPALGDPNIYNLGSTANLSQIKALNSSLYLDQGANPHVSYLGDRYGLNTHSQVKAVLLSYSELNFLLAEAALKGWIPAEPAAFFQKGIEASLDQYELAEGVQKVYNRFTHQLVSFNRTGFLADLVGQFKIAGSGQLELLMTQKWVSLWMTPEFWFDWRRTGLPKLGTFVVEGSKGDKIPVRLIYGTKEYIVNELQVGEAVGRLQPNVDDQWSKMWLLQGQPQPW